MSQALRSTERTPTHCRVCGCDEVCTDDVLDQGWLQLAECPRCDHRWTSCGEPPARTIQVRRVLRLAPEVASAA